MKDKIEEIVWLRAIATLCIVVGHCFGMYDDWIPINDHVNSICYKIYEGVNPLTTYLALPLFVFISGYLMAHGKEVKFKTFIIKKTVRLLVPGIILSLLYYLLFKPNPLDDIISVIINLLMNGYGHLWFLYMLFGIYVIGWFHVKHLKTKRLILNLIFTVIPSFIFMFCSISRGVGQILFYYFFFFIGVATYINKYRLKKISYNIKPFSLILIYIMAFIIFSSIKLVLSPKIANTALVSFNHWFYRFVIGMVGVLTIFLLSIREKNYIFSVVMNRISSNSFLMYILHQFILIGLLTSDMIVSLFQFSQVFFPFILTLIVLLSSYVLSSILYKNKYVRKHL
ncbi:MAG: acyltransferase [Bacteroidales bacterium]|nr:acyltransferase [Bacteroidales bacterium]